MKTWQINLLLPLLLLLLPTGATGQTSPNRIIGYFTSWSVYGRNYHVTQIPAAKITHINYAFAKIVNGRIALGDFYADVDKFYPGDTWQPGALRGSFHQLQILKQKHSHLRTFISIGGWTWSGAFSDAVLTAASRQTFATSCVDFIVKYGFDGIDIDWEYPGGGGLPGNKVRPQDPQNFTLFLTELRRQLTAKGKATNKTYLLTIAAAADPAKIAKLEVTKIHPLLDWINIMSFDYHGPWQGIPDPVTNFNSPLYPTTGDPCPKPYNTTFNVANTVNEYRTKGVPASKLQISLAFYGRGYAGVRGTQNGLFGKYTGPAAPGTWESGVFDYSDLVTNYIGKNGYKTYWSEEARVPWIHNPTRGVMISYDNPRSIREKAWFIKAQGLGGAMFWEFSGDRKGDLLNAAYQVLRQSPTLVTTAGEIKLSAPAPLTLNLSGGANRAGRIYITMGSLSGTFPGINLPGGVLPLNWDHFTNFALSTINSPLFANHTGTLDPMGRAKCQINLTGIAPLPTILTGQRLTFSTWVLTQKTSLAGEASNPVEINLR